MSLDVSQLNLQAPDPIEWDQYQEAGSPQAPPIAGTYTGAVEKIDITATKEGKLMFVLDPVTIVGPTASGEQVRFTKVSTKKYKNRNASPAGDYLRAHGIVLTHNPSNEEYVTLFESTVGKPFNFDLDWEAYDKEDQTSFEGMETFPVNPDGTRNFFITNPSTGNRVRARARVRRFKSAVA